MTPDELRARVLYRDAEVLIINKPPGLAVHQGPGKGHHLEELLEALRFDARWPPLLAHRLDKDTSGCLVLGRTREAVAKLGHLFARGRVEKKYWAIVEGTPPETSGRIDLALKKRAPDRGWWMIADPSGQPAVTDYRLIGIRGARAFLELTPRTGRTHQIRVHCAAIGCAVVGDMVYGPRAGQLRREALHLHARAIRIPYARDAEPITAEAPPPPHMEEAIARYEAV